MQGLPAPYVFYYEMSFSFVTLIFYLMVVLRDFPGGSGESTFTGRAKPWDITTREGRQAVGLEPFVPRAAANDKLIDAVNRVLFG
jgi:hypothetical protein